MKKANHFKKKMIVGAATLLLFGANIPLGIGTTAHAEQTQTESRNISGNAVSDETTPRVLNVWKYEIQSNSDLGERGDGFEKPDLTGKKTMKDVTFSVERVKPIGNVSLTDPLKQKKDEAYTIDTSFQKMEVATDEQGRATFNIGTGKSADGIYLVKEISTTYTAEDGSTKEISSPMAPFFVHLPQTKRDDTGKLIYDVNVYPKNIVTDTAVDKTIEGGKGYSIKAGNGFQWEATTKLPDGLYYKADKELTITDVVDKDGNPQPDIPVAVGQEVYANYVTVTDELVEDLLLDDIVVQASTDGSSNWTTLDNGNQYTVTLNGTTISPGQSVKDVTPGQKKKVVVDLTQQGMKELTTGKATYLRVIYKTHVDKDFNGTISNEYTMAYLIPGQKPHTKTTEEKPEYYSGGFGIDKTTEDANKKLANAEFHIADSKENADAKKYLASDGQSYAEGELPTGVTYLTAKSDDQGRASFNGLKLEWFTDTNGNGQQDPEITAEKTWDVAEIKKDYWIVETKAPSGYELLKNPEKVTVKLDTHENLHVRIENKAKTDLPFTGGEGMTLLIVLALGAITVGAVIVTIEKKRRAA